MRNIYTRYHICLMRVKSRRVSLNRRLDLNISFLLFLTVTRYVCETPGTYTNIFFLILRLMSYNDACFFSLLPWDTHYTHALRVYITCS